MITAFEIVLTIETDDTGRQVKAETSQVETPANEWPELPHLQPLNWTPATLTAAKATLFALLAAVAVATAAPKPAELAALTWSTNQIAVTNHVTGRPRWARTAPATDTFWKLWNADKPAMRAAGYSCRPLTNGFWQALNYNRP